MDYLNTKLFMKNPTKSSLRRKGFRYDVECSTKEYDCFTYNFPIDYYHKIPVVMCRIRIYLDNGETNVDVINCGDGSLYPAWYLREDRLYNYQKEYLTKIDKKIREELIKLGLILEYSSSGK